MAVVLWLRTVFIKILSKGMRTNLIFFVHYVFDLLGLGDYVEDFFENSYRRTIEIYSSFCRLQHPILLTTRDLLYFT